MYKLNGNISITGLTPEMFESATDPILKCSNLYKTLCSIITKWKKICPDDIIKVLIITNIFVVFVYLTGDNIAKICLHRLNRTCLISSWSKIFY